jgi:hypothetical protein
MVPLFMAGDKLFNKFVANLQKQTGIKLNVRGDNSLESTHFKTGFAGVGLEFNKNNLYQLSIMNQLKLLKFAFKNYFLNPSYINSSIYDNAMSLYARQYSKKSDVFDIYKYVKWDEKNIINLLTSKYDWELAKDTIATWRIGDGTAPFYNYIYFNIAGFSEFDTFRSNQIREGSIKRKDALKIAFEENYPRYESLKWYLTVIGLDFESTIKKINQIPKLY